MGILYPPTIAPIQAIDPIGVTALHRFVFFSLSGLSEICIKYYNGSTFYYLKIENIEGTPKTIKDNPSEFVALLYADLSALDAMVWQKTAITCEKTGSVGDLNPDLSITSIDGHILLATDPNVNGYGGSPNGMSQISCLHGVKNFTNAFWANSTIGHISYNGRGLIGCSAEFIMQDFIQHGDSRYDEYGQITNNTGRAARYLVAFLQEDLRDSAIDTLTQVPLPSVLRLITYGSALYHNSVLNNEVFIEMTNGLILSEIYKKLRVVHWREWRQL